MSIAELVQRVASQQLPATRMKEKVVFDWKSHRSRTTMALKPFVLVFAEGETSMVLKKDYTTVNCDSPVGKRLSKVRKQSDMFVVFQGKRVPIVSRISIGRGSDNTIELKDSLASRHHAMIQKAGDEYFIEDLDSTNGTFVNGTTVPPGKYLRLHQEDSILIGRTRLSLRQFATRVLR